MFGSARVARAWRPVVLVLAGAALGATMVNPVAASFRGPGVVQATPIYSRVASCSAQAFVPRDGYSAYGSTGYLRYNAGGGSGYFICDPGLPNGAVVTKVQFTVLDNDATGNMKDCSLMRAGLTTGLAGSAQHVGGPLATAGTPGKLRLGDTSITYARVDNAKYSYWLQCQMTDSSIILGIYGASVTYTISATKG